MGFVALRGETQESSASRALQPGVKQLFLDDAVVEKTVAVKRTLHQLRKYSGNPVLKAERPWEGNAVGIRTAPYWHPERNRFEMYYIAGPVTCLVVSGDGLNWTRPMLDHVEYEASKQNNIVNIGERERFLFHVVHDPLDPDPQRRWKGLIGERGPRPAASPDGLHWALLADKAIPSGEEGHLIYDESSRQFVFSLRTMHENDGHRRRAVNVATSTDFVHWTDPQLAFFADQKDDVAGRAWLEKYLADPFTYKPMANDPAQYNTQLYNMGIFPYEGLYIGLPTLFRMTGVVRADDGLSETGLTVSRTLLDWQWVADRAAAFNPLSRLDESPHDAAQIEPPSRPLRHGDELWFYYTGTNNRPVHPSLRETYRAVICVGMLRLDGFVSLDAFGKTGSVLTRPLKWNGSSLWVNADASGGAVHVELLDETGDPLAHFTQAAAIGITTDSVRARAHWQGNVRLDSLAGRTVRLRFTLDHARLYAFWTE